MELLVTYPKANSLFKVSSENTDVIAYFKQFYLEINDCERYCFCCIHTIVHTKNNDIIFDDQESYVASEFEVIPTINRFIRSHMHFKPDWSAYHGTSVILNNKVYLLLGKSGAGKTTLAMYLGLKECAAILSEDITMINWHTLEIIPQSYPVALRKESYDVLKNKYGCVFQCDGINFNGKYLYKNSAKYNLNTKYYLDKCFVLDRNTDHADIACVPITNLMPYIFNSYCPNNTKSNIMSAQFLSKRNILYKLSYDNLDLVYFFLNDLSKQ